MKSSSPQWIAVVFCLVTMVFSGCVTQEKVPESSTPDIRNVIILVADGMGPQALGLLNAYAKYAPRSLYADRGRVTAVEQAINSGTLGCVYHESSGALVADSASSATQMASGAWALPETVGIDREGRPTVTILEIARGLGKSTGLVSDTRLTHATPAGFAAHQVHRSRENEIAVDLLKSRVDVMLSGGLRNWIPRVANDSGSEVHGALKERTGGGIKIASKRKDDRNLLTEAEGLGYSLVFTRTQLAGVRGKRILGLFGTSGLPFRIDVDPASPDRTIPLLREMTTKALEVLGANPKGFFLLVESGQIDWAGHDNDAGTLLHELIRFDETVACLLDWVRGRNDTLLIITADHETGGFGFSYSRRNVPGPRPFPGSAFSGETFAPAFNFGNHELLDRIHGQRESFRSMLGRFDGLSEEKRTEGKLAEIVNESTAFEITADEGKAVLTKERNEFRIEGHKYLSAETFPVIRDFKEYYVYGNEVRKDILGRILAGKQNVVWSTGTHTNTPVPLIVLGPKGAREGFGRLMHTTTWARLAIDALRSGGRATRD
jgi:alkaline phosphatase